MQYRLFGFASYKNSLLTSVHGGSDAVVKSRIKNAKACAFPKSQKFLSCTPYKKARQIPGLCYREASLCLLGVHHLLQFFRQQKENQGSKPCHSYKEHEEIVHGSHFITQETGGFTRFGVKGT